MGTKLFVGGISWNTDEDGLRKAFAEYGNVTEAKIITDRESGRSKGFGFVSFENSGEAQEALQSMNNANLDGRSLRVDWATAKSPSPSRGGQRERRY